MYKKKFIKKVRDPYFEHDALTGDVYTDMSFLKTLSITKDSAKANTYVVSYIAHTVDGYSKKEYKEPVTIDVTVIKEKSAYKIDKVW